MTWLDPRVWLVVIAATVGGLAGGYFKGHADGTRATVGAAQKAQLAAVAAARADLSVISWAGHIMRCKSHGYANEEEKANCSASGSGPRAAA
ncbi:hypothetical protein [Burkholderia vietnamiensis]|uniref:hypothetical protein n=1 Tax=Burkholderia vietnamiensis TaxID=60552 RepID=UPI001B8FC102|nr:hypothetical protein [Burkholderia vietnamiensis]MBR8206736.1 hypothetical protein [Burkholderia vietnamiensis]